MQQWDEPQPPFPIGSIPASHAEDMDSIESDIDPALYDTPLDLSLLPRFDYGIDQNTPYVDPTSYYVPQSVSDAWMHHEYALPSTPPTVYNTTSTAHPSSCGFVQPSYTHDPGQPAFDGYDLGQASSARDLGQPTFYTPSMPFFYSDALALQSDLTLGPLSSAHVFQAMPVVGPSSPMWQMRPLFTVDPEYQELSSDLDTTVPSEMSSEMLSDVDGKLDTAQMPLPDNVPAFDASLFLPPPSKSNLLSIASASPATSFPSHAVLSSTTTSSALAGPPAPSMPVGNPSSAITPTYPGTPADPPPKRELTLEDIRNGLRPAPSAGQIESQRRMALLMGDKPRSKRSLEKRARMSAEYDANNGEKRKKMMAFLDEVCSMELDNTGRYTGRRRPGF